jgi:hypothetical protein
MGVAHCDVKGGYVRAGDIDADPEFVVGDSWYHAPDTE